MPSKNENQEKKELKLKKQKQKILNALASHDVSTTNKKAAHVLNRSVKARNSDKEFIWEYWSTFENEYVSDGYVTKEDFLKLSKASSLARARRVVQNDLKLFQASPEVQAFRQKLAHSFKQDYAPSERQSFPLYRVFIDESGKTGDYLCVGSVWSYSYTSLQSNINNWKKSNNIKYEFHFRELKKQKLDTYKQFIREVLAFESTLAFKVILVNRKGLRDVQRAVEDLTFQLLSKGVKHENESGRARLPRFLEVFIDSDEAGSDQLKCENISERLNSEHIDGLHLDFIEPIDSKKSVYIQLVDLLIASINRKLNESQVRNHKDELADFVLETFNFDIDNLTKVRSDVDSAEVFNLSDFGS